MGPYGRDQPATINAPEQEGFWDTIIEPKLIDEVRLIAALPTSHCRLRSHYQGISGIIVSYILEPFWLFVRATPRAVDSTFRSLQFVSASLYSLGHGGNDAQKTMGIIAVLLFSQGQLGSEFHVPFWVVLTCQAAMGL